MSDLKFIIDFKKENKDNIIFIDNEGKEHEGKIVQYVPFNMSDEYLIDNLSSNEYDFLYSQPIRDFWEEIKIKDKQLNSWTIGFLILSIPDFKNDSLVYLSYDINREWISFETTSKKQNHGKIKVIP